MSRARARARPLGSEANGGGRSEVYGTSLTATVAQIVVEFMSVTVSTTSGRPGQQRLARDHHTGRLLGVRARPPQRVVGRADAGLGEEHVAHTGW
jgi:hypothetical protein